MNTEIMTEEEYKTEDESSVSTKEIQSQNYSAPFDETDWTEITISIMELADEYMDNHIIKMSDPQFQDTMVNSITQEILDQWTPFELFDESAQEEIYDHVESCVDDYFEMGIIKPRSYKTAALLRDPDVPYINEKIAIIKSYDQPDQRTPEWYEFRHSLISASSISKCIGSDAQINSIIYEKCKPFEHRQDGPVNTESPMHWGQKYEPVSSKLYEHMYGTQVGEFGCIRHPVHSFIGASPDGINVDSLSPRYGRMLEIKNIVNRELNGIPKKEYWVQMQIQLEVCDLDECDFLETVFKEYPDEDAFYSDTEQRDYKGVILYFVQRISIGDASALATVNHNPKYEYIPFDIELTKENIENWILEKRRLLRRDWSLYEVKYWYLEDYSCVMVPRNREWFLAAVPIIQDTWETIQKERESGYEHRAAKKKVNWGVTMNLDVSNNYVIKNMPVSNSVCLVKLE